MAPDEIAEVALIEISRVERLADAWRGCRREVDECIFWIGEALKRGKNPSAHRIVRYREYVRLVSGYEADMDYFGVKFERTAI